MGNVDSSEKGAYIRQATDGKYGEEVTNVMSIKSGNAFTLDDLATGDPIKCSSCDALLNKFSIITPSEEKGLYNWVCEFCGEINRVSMDPEEMPKMGTATYVLEKTPLVEEKKEKQLEDISVIFCVDISGSMDSTSPAKTESKYNKFKGCISRLEAVKLAID